MEARSEFVTSASLYCVIKAVRTSLSQQESAAGNLPLPQRMKQLSRLVKPECDMRQKSKQLRQYFPIHVHVFHSFSKQNQTYPNSLLCYHWLRKTDHISHFVFCPLFFSIYLSPFLSPIFVFFFVF